MRENELQETHDGSKPVNINISFNINPKNILNSVMPIQNKPKGRKISNQEILPSRKHGLTHQPLKTPELIQTDRNIYNKEFDLSKPIEQSKKKKSRKRNSIESDFNRDNSFKQSDCDKSIKLMKKNQLPNSHARRKSTKSKGTQGIKSKRKTSKHTDDQIKLGCRTVGFENNGLKSATMDYNVTERKIVPQTNLKSATNKIATNEFSKSSFPYSAISKTKQFIQSRQKPRKKSAKNNKSQTMLHVQQDVENINRKKLIEKLTSLRSMNNSIFQTEIEEDNIKRSEKSIIIHTQQSIPCIEEMHEYELRQKYADLDLSEQQGNGGTKAHETQNLISTYIAIMQEQVEYEGEEEEVEDKQNPIKQTIQRYKRERENYLLHEEEGEEEAMKTIEIDESKPQKGEDIRPFCSSQMTKEQSLINELERIKLNELKKHEIEKWGELLAFIKNSLKNGKANTEQILSNVYTFLERTKQDLQNEVQTSRKVVTKENLDQFTNKLSSKNEKVEEEEKVQSIEMEEISSMSFQENQGEEDEQLKLMNLQTIENALKQRYESLIERQQREIASLEEQRDQGKMSEIDFILEKEKIEKWIKNETNQIMKAKKNIWKGYNEAKGILQKTAKSKYFEENESSGKKKTMMKCLSENYLLKANYKKIVFSKEDQSKGSSEKDSEGSVDEEQSFNENINEENEMEKIKERLLDIKHKHLQEEEKAKEVGEESPNISYEEVEKELEESYSSQEMNIIKNQATKDYLKSPSLPIGEEKLKYICGEDKEDIFEFIFLDLCIQLYQEPCKDNAIMESIGRYISKVKQQANKKKGVRTNLNVVKEYLKRFTGYIMRTNKDILKTIDDPLGPTAIEMLRYMHDNDEENHDEEDVQTTLVIPISIFDQFERTLLPSIEFQKYYQNDQEKQNKRVQFLKNILHIHNKAIFDALNEYLDQLRPFGIWGKPFPWKNNATFFHQTDDLSKETKLKKASDKVIEYCSYVCGLLIDKEESLVGNARLSEQYVQQIKQDRLSRMLANELVQNEERWLFYDDEETQVMVEIGNFIFLMLMKEATIDISGII